MLASLDEPVRRGPTAPPPAGRWRKVCQHGTIDVSQDGAGTTWCFMCPPGSPCFSPDLLADLAATRSELRLDGGGLSDSAAEFRFLVLASRRRGVFSLGNDLELFAGLIRRGERVALRRYAYDCIDALHANSEAGGSSLATVALVQGNALGGGFECALSCDVIVAERQARMGFPEVLFDLFPAAGAYSFLSRRLDPMQAHKVLLGGRIHTAEELHAMGVVDVLADDGEGASAVREFIARHGGSSEPAAGDLRARRRQRAVSREELRAVADVWINSALKLRRGDLRRMRRLATLQERLCTRPWSRARTARAD